jgi:hypothetical protein
MERELEETKRKLNYAESQINSGYRNVDVMELGDADRYQRHYIDALAAVENYTTLSAKYDRRIKLARMHLEVFFIHLYFYPCFYFLFFFIYIIC